MIRLQKEKADKLMGSTDNPPGEEIHEIINTGSQAEVLSFPMIQSKENSPCNFQVDIDSMIVLKNFVAISPEERDEVTITSPFDQAEQLIIDYDHTPPGYVRLRSDRGYFGVAFDEDCSGKGSIIKGVERKPFTFFNTMEMVKYLLPCEKINITEKYLHGPAISVSMEFSHGGKMSPMMDDDLVLCIQSLDWPRVAEGWRTRESEWPGASVKEEIVEMGCHLVPVHHAASKSPEIEWRLSFSEAEKELALKMSATVKSAYLLVKIVMKSLCLKGYGISSYFLKTTLLWMCDKDAHLQDVSYDQIGIVFMQIFDALIENLNNGTIEHFFVPENNLLSWTPRKNIDKAVDLLQVARKDPLKLLMGFTQSFKFYGFYEFPDFSIFDPIVELLRSNDMEKIVESKISVTKALVEFNLTWLEKTRPMKGFYVIGEIVFFTMSFLARTLVKEGEPVTEGLEYVYRRIKSVNEENSMTYKRHFMKDLMYSDDV